jgi:hypothetical protein
MMIWIVNMEQLVEWELAGETEVLGEYQSQCLLSIVTAGRTPYLTFNVEGRSVRT